MRATRLAALFPVVLFHFGLGLFAREDLLLFQTAVFGRIGRPSQHLEDGTLLFFHLAVPVQDKAVGFPDEGEGNEVGIFLGPRALLGQTQQILGRKSGIARGQQGRQQQTDEGESLHGHPPGDGSW